MVKPGRRPLRRLPRLAPVAAAVMLASPACHADWRFQPGVSVVGTYSDNIGLQSDALAETQFITEVAPTFNLAVRSRRLNATASGEFRQFIYRDENERPRPDTSRRYNAGLQGVVLDDLLMVDASASSSQQNISAFGPQVESNPYSLENRTQVRTWTLSPYLVQRFGRQANAMLRFTRSAVHSDRRSQFGNSTADTVALNLSSGPAYGNFGWSFIYLQQDEVNSLRGSSEVESAAANLRYRLDPTFSLTANLGYDRYDYGGLGGSTGGRNWSTGFIWTPSQRTSVVASAGRHFYGNTGSLAANVRSRRSVWSINYADTITTSHSQFTLPAAIDTASLLDRLFTTMFPDPVQRQLAVAAYMLETGLPPSLADNINYLSNRYMRQKLLQASSAFSGARSAVVLSLNASERNALSSQESDSALLGGQLARLNDNVRQRGANALWSYRLNPRAGLVASASYSHRESLGLLSGEGRGIETVQRELRFGMNRKLGRNVVAVVDLRRRSGILGTSGTRDYTEHAVSATLSMKL